jgi:hypothetical protein
MRWTGRTRHAETTAAATPAEIQASMRALEANAVLRMAQDLRVMVEMVNLEEFYWQEKHYDHDSRQGRELLFLMANHEWVRATSEIMDISRSDAVETTIKIDIDLSRISHEAFRARTGRLWLPVAILPPGADERRPDPGSADAQLEDGLRSLGAQSRLEPDPFATVTDAAGGLLPLLPAVDLRHQIAAALAEIIVKMAVSHLPTSDDQPQADADEERAKALPVATLDQRLLLSAAIYQMLSLGTSRNIDPAESKPATGTPRLKRARAALLGLLDTYIESLRHVAEAAKLKAEAARNQRGVAAGTITGPAAGPGEAARRNRNKQVRGPQFTPELARRAIIVMQALAESVIVVIPLDYNTGPTVLTVRVPTRTLQQTSKWSWYKPTTWLIKPSGHLEIDVLLPTADTDRQIQVNLPNGVLLDGPASVAGAGRGEFPHLDIDVHTPPSLLDLSTSMKQVILAQGYSRDPARRWPLGLVESCVELARLKSAAALATLQHYTASYTDSRSLTVALGNPYTILNQLAADLERLTPITEAALERIKEAWQRLRIDRLTLSRRTLTDRLSPQTVVARVDMIEDVAQRATPKHAKVYVDVTVDDRDYFSIARSSAWMSFLLMVGVLSFLLFWRKTAPTTEVLAIVLTLFATIQASRIERPDRSTLQGQLFAIGNALIAASMLPPVTLAVVLAFRPSGSTADIWAGCCCFAQLFLLLIMRWGPLTPAGSFIIGSRRNFQTYSLDYRHFEALRSDYWRNTTADALMIGREAYGYVVWQRVHPSEGAELASPKLRNLLIWDEESVPGESSSVLALLRSGTQHQAVTFVVFRGKPDESKWPTDIGVRQRTAVRRDPDARKDIYYLKPLDLDPGRLAPSDSVISTVDVFVGIPHAEIPIIVKHPIVIVMKAATKRLIVLDAQLPVPAPVKWHDGWKWARIRVALRDSDDIRRLTGFMDAVQKEMTQPENCRYVLAMQAVPTAEPRIIKMPAGASPIRGRDSEVQVLASDLDIVNCETVSGEPPDARTWRVLTICADARSNIESDIIQHLASVREHFQLAGLTYGLLHGTAVIMLLVHEPDLSADAIAQHEENRAAELQASLRKEPAWAKLRVFVDKRLSRRELQPVTTGTSPLLRARFRWRDRPGASLNVLDSIASVLGEELTGLEQKDWSISYARLQVVTGQAALGRLTIRMHIDADEIRGWNFSTMEEIGRKIETLAAAEAQKRKTPSPGDDLDEPEDPVINIGRIKRRRPLR